jgi:stage IV sporulation protein FB
MKKLHPAFFVFIVIILFLGRARLLLIYFFALILHECAHALVASRLGYRLKNLYLMPYGACLMYQDIFFEDDELKIAVAGPIASLGFALLTMALWWIYPAIYSVTYEFVVANFALAFFNLLPAFPLDGARIFINIVSEKIERKKAFKLTTIFNYVFCAIFLFAFVISFFTKVNFNFLLIALFLFIGVFDGYFQAKYFNIYQVDKSRFLKRGVSAKTLAFSSNSTLLSVLKKISSYRYTVFVIVFENGKTRFFSEDYLKTIFNKFNLNLTFNDIYLVFKQ